LRKMGPSNRAIERIPAEPKARGSDARKKQKTKATPAKTTAAAPEGDSEKGCHGHKTQRPTQRKNRRENGHSSQTKTLARTRQQGIASSKDHARNKTGDSMETRHNREKSPWSMPARRATKNHKPSKRRMHMTKNTSHATQATSPVRMPLARVKACGAKHHTLHKAQARFPKQRPRHPNQKSAKCR
jgi:hypothetical protein